MVVPLKVQQTINFTDVDECQLKFFKKYNAQEQWFVIQLDLQFFYWEFFVFIILCDIFMLDLGTLQGFLFPFL